MRLDQAGRRRRRILRGKLTQPRIIGGGGDGVARRRSAVAAPAAAEDEGRRQVDGVSGVAAGDLALLRVEIVSSLSNIL